MTEQKLKSFTDIIKLRCNDLLDIINDILDISKIESGQLPVNIVETDLNELFSDLTSFFYAYQKRYDKQHIKLSLLSLKLPAGNLILTDKVKLKQILINLISNAYKFTDEGWIEWGCRLDENNNLVFSISDTGIGIPEEKHQFIFERFTQLQQGGKKNRGGTGLGLSIVKALVELLGGKISLKSAPGKGSTFSFFINYNPVKIPSHVAADETDKDAYRFPGKSILIVEDDPYNAEYIKEVLIDSELVVLLAESGIDAIETSLSRNIDLVLMDIRLPDISGFEATSQIRNKKPDLKVIAQTAYAAQEDRQKAFDAGCIDYLSKPINPDSLMEMLNKYLK